MGNVTFDFSGRTVIVTGGAQGIGREVGRLFVESGAEVFLVDLDEAALAAAAADTGCRTISANVASTEDVERAVASVIAETGRIDVLINNAGILRDKLLWKLEDSDWDEVLAVHAGGTFRLTRACVPHFRAQNFGRVVNVTSYSGQHGNVGQSNYATAKAGIIGFTKTVAKELARFGVTVNAISPNAETRMVASIPAEKLAEIAAGIPLGRFGRSEEMATAIAFLASDEASYITGAVLDADGGLSM